MQLMPFQINAVAAIAAQLACSASVLLQSATGSGKTCIGLSYVARCVTENPRFNTLVIVPSQALVDQMFLTCLALGLRVSVLHDTITRSSQGHKFSYDRRANVLISMPETFMNTVNGVNNLEFDKRWVANLLLQDEAHKNTSAESQAVRDYFPGVKVLGLSATPRREQNADGEHLFDWYDDRMITTVGINELVEMGRLARPEYRVYKPTDHVVSKWLSATEGHSNRSTIMFVKETSDALAYMASFKEHGITAEIVTGGSIVHNVTCQTPLQRQAIFSRFDSGATEVLITVNALCEGFDSPRAHFCILMRNVVAEALYHQMVGRVLRAYPGKLEGVVMDFFNNVKQFGRVEDKRWSVMDYAPRSIQHVPGERISTKQFAAKTRMMFTCTNCAHVFDVKQNKHCTHCDAPAVVDLFEPVNEMFERLFKKTFKSDDELRSFCSTLRGFANTKHGDIMYNQLRAAKNKAFGIELFVVEGGFNSQYKHVEQVVNDSTVRRKQEIAMAA